MAAADVIDLTDEDALEQSQRRRIMAQARKALAASNSRATPSSSMQVCEVVELGSDAGGDDDGDGAAAHMSEGEGKAPKRLRGASADTAPPATLPAPSDPSSEWPATAPFPAPPMNPMNDMLRALHQERLARQQAQAQQIQGPAGANNTTASSKPDTPGPPPQLLSDAGDGDEPFTPVSAVKRLRWSGVSPEEATPPSPARSAECQDVKLASAAPEASTRPCQPAFTILTYNVWFQPTAMQDRMRGLAGLIRDLDPDVLLLQEVTEDVMTCFLMDSPWLTEDYQWSPPPNEEYFTLVGWKEARVEHRAPLQRLPFRNSVMATSHLESPMGRDKTFSEARLVQLTQGLEVLEQRAADLAPALQPPPSQAPSEQHEQQLDIVWAGDMNWIASMAAPKLRPGWQDVWAALRPHEPGATYDPKRNDMLRHVRLPASRMDRAFARLSSWRVAYIRMVGDEPIPKMKPVVEGGRKFRLLPSDHFGVLLQLALDREQ